MQQRGDGLEYWLLWSNRNGQEDGKYRVIALFIVIKFGNLMPMSKSEYTESIEIVPYDDGW